MKTNVFKTIVLLAVLVACKENKTTEEGTLKEADATHALITKSYLDVLTSQSTTAFPSYNPNFPPPPDATEVFKLSQNYPDTLITETYPWQTIDFKTNPDQYINTVLTYCLEGNVEVDFKGQDNAVRKWYHAPWLHDDGNTNGNGREYIHGLTRERGTPEFEIHNKQNVRLENWAVGMYNAPGGYTLGQVWASPNTAPDPSKANFPEGTVSFKLLFTDGTTDKVPFLEGTKQWQANIYQCGSSSCRRNGRMNRTVSLLQIDVAVKDARASKTGWVFGTFMYDASHSGTTVWERMVPVGLSWGDDQDVLTDLNKDGAFINSELQESYINASLIVDTTKTYTNQAYIKYHGLGGRLNGPVDNPISSCISCHGQAGVNNEGRVLPMGAFSSTRQNYTLSNFNTYFTDVSPGGYVRNFGGNNYNTTDYSLQLSAGIRNYYQNEILKAAMASNQMLTTSAMDTLSMKSINKVKKEMVKLPEVSRGEAIETEQTPANQ